MERLKESMLPDDRKESAGNLVMVSIFEIVAPGSEAG